MTEDEARKCWCPFARIRTYREAVAYNRTTDGGDFFPNPSKARCIASECMAWRQFGEHGWCGLAGRPGQ